MYPDPDVGGLWLALQRSPRRQARPAPPADPTGCPDPDAGGLRAVLWRTPPPATVPARCHPQLPHHGRGLCSPCFIRAGRYGRLAVGALTADPADLVIVVPMLGRPQHIGPLLASIDDTVPAARVLFVLSPHDAEVRRTVEAAGREAITIPYQTRGDYARKINAGYRHTTQGLIFTGASDLRFHPGWFEAAVAQLRPGIGVVGTNDLGSPRVVSGEHATHSLVTRWYADRCGTVDAPGAILHEGYWHEFVDDELVATAKHRGAWAFAADSHVEHLHPNWNKGAPDLLYSQQGQRIRAGRPLFRRRRQLWT